MIALIVDDHPLVARGIADFLRSHCGFAAAGISASAAEALAHLRQSDLPDLVVLDFWLPEGASLPFLAELRQLSPLPRVLVTSAYDDGAIQEKVRSAGAAGFVHKREAPAVFAQAVTALCQGKSWFREGPKEHQPRELPVSAAELGLTARQGQVLALVLKGLPNKRIARDLGLSEATVKEHVTGILERLGVRNRIEVITRLRGKRIE